MSGPDRRRFLAQFLGGAAATLTAPTLLGADTGVLSSLRAGIGPALVDDERYWRRVREHFPLNRGLTLMNAANLCPSPYPVQDAVFRYTRDVDGDASFQNRGKFGPLKEEAREALARSVGAEPGEALRIANTAAGISVTKSGTAVVEAEELKRALEGVC